MVKVVALGHPVADVARLWPAHAQENGITIAQGYRNDTMAGLFVLVAVECGHNIFFHFILVSNINDAFRISAHDIQINMAFPVGNGPGLRPIDHFLAVGILLHHGEAQFFHDPDIDAGGIA